MHHISRDIDLIKLHLFPILLGLALAPAPIMAPSAYAATAAPPSVAARVKIDDFVARVPVHVLGEVSASPQGLTPDQIKAAYRLPKTGGSGTIALVTAYADKNIESDLAAFDAKFNLPACTIKNGCLTIHEMSSTTKQSSGWALETALDVEWAHAMAPNAKLLVVEAQSDSGAPLLKAVDYATARKGTVAVSMSWGGDEFKDETKDDSHFKKGSIAFFAASGDNGYGASWPAASPNVISVGGTSLAFDKSGSIASEKAWDGSGGGVSAYEKEPGFQKSYSIAKAGGMRAIPDVSFDADPNSGFSVFHSAAISAASATSTASTSKGWYVVGGTSAGAPQWAGIRALDSAATSSVAFEARLYEEKASASHSAFFRDITSGSNGTCSYYCDARAHYDYVTGLGSPITYRF